MTRHSFFLKFPLVAATMWFSACAALSAQPFITSVAPLEGSIGTQITITGGGFGPKKPKVLFFRQDERTGRLVRAKAKVLSSTDAQIVVEMRKGTAGTYEVAVRAKKAAAIVAADPFRMMPPVIVGPEFPLVVEPFEEVQIQGGFFGLRPKVRIGRKKAKVLGVDDEELVFLVPKGLKPGLHEIEIANKTGRALVEGAIDMPARNDSPPGLQLSVKAKPGNNIVEVSWRSTGRSRFFDLWFYVGSGIQWQHVFGTEDRSGKALIRVTGSHCFQMTGHLEEEGPPWPVRNILERAFAGNESPCRF